METNREVTFFKSQTIDIEDKAKRKKIVMCKKRNFYLNVNLKKI